MFPESLSADQQIRWLNTWSAKTKFADLIHRLAGLKKMSDALDRGLDEDDIAVLFGCSVQTVRATLSLLEATQAVREAVEAGTVTVTQARQLALLKPEEQREKVSEIEAATAGTTGHEKARRQRQILGEAKPRLKTRKEITKAPGICRG